MNCSWQKNDPEAFIEHFNLLLFAGNMKDHTKSVILAHMNSIASSNSLKRAREALFLMMASPEQNYVH
jgi:hypothetical protein